MNFTKMRYYRAEIEVEIDDEDDIVTMSEGADIPGAGPSEEFDDLWGEG